MSVAATQLVLYQKSSLFISAFKSNLQKENARESLHILLPVELRSSPVSVELRDSNEGRMYRSRLKPLHAANGSGFVPPQRKGFSCPRPLDASAPGVAARPSSLIGKKPIQTPLPPSAKNEIREEEKPGTKGAVAGTAPPVTPPTRKRGTGFVLVRTTDENASGKAAQGDIKKSEGTSAVTGAEKKKDFYFS